MSLEPSRRGQIPAAIATVGLSRDFGDLTAVDRLDLTIETGEFLGLLGSNGAGKSTTIKMLTTLLPPTSGSARVVGFDIVRQARQVRRHIGYVPQMLSADAGLTGRENLMMFAKLYDVPQDERASRVTDALTFMGLGDVGAKLVRTYSGGMIRRLEIAQALLHRPAVVFLDEPTVGLDPVAKHAVWEKLKELRATFGTTVSAHHPRHGGGGGAVRVDRHHAQWTPRRARHAGRTQGEGWQRRHDGRCLRPLHRRCGR